jgi:iron-sulfur cluster insertion protein
MTQTASDSFAMKLTDSDIRLTAAAQAKIAELIVGAEADIKGIRVFVSGGGCGGMAYGMTYAEAITEHDSTLAWDRGNVIVDAVALNYLRGCEIDFAQDNFIFNNVFQAVGGSGACGGCGGGGGF